MQTRDTQSLEAVDRLPAPGRLPFVCVACHAPLPEPPAENALVLCPKCDYAYYLGKDYIKYDPNPLLKKKFEKDWVRWKAVSNNGYLSYLYLKGTSLSLPNREDVQRFRRFVEMHMRRGHVLDIGCGPLAVPGYLMFDDSQGIDLIGLDPMENIEFSGTKVIGCAEYLPWTDGSLDTIIFGTSLDHVCSLDTTITECHRVLAPGGRIVIWMGDRTDDASILERIKRRLKSFRDTLRKGYRVDRFWAYPNGVVLFVPDGAIDPFHTFPEQPDHIVEIFSERGFVIVSKDYISTNEVHLCFEKAGGNGAAPSPE